jgi:C_GCAxxG_C_C family probable redox protein
MTDRAIKLAMKYFSKDYNCAQSVLRSVLEEKGLAFDEIFNLAAGFGGGVGLQGYTCGAVSGAVAALGVINGKKFDDAVKHKEATYESVAKFMQMFKEKNQTIICNELTGIIMADKEAHDRALEDGTFEKVCPGYVQDAVRIVLRLTKD